MSGWRPLPRHSGRIGAGSALYDVVYTSFALHHLPTEQKAEFFCRVAERLEKDGLLLLTDIVREEDESLPVYLGLGSLADIFITPLEADSAMIDDNISEFNAQVTRAIATLYKAHPTKINLGVEHILVPPAAKTDTDFETRMVRERHSHMAV